MTNKIKQLFIIISILSLTACGGGGGSSSDSASAETTSTTETEVVEQPEEVNWTDREMGQRYAVTVNYFLTEQDWNSLLDQDIDVDEFVEQEHQKVSWLFATQLDIELQLGVVAVDESEAATRSTAMSQINFFSYWSKVEEGYSGINVRIGNVVRGSGSAVTGNACAATNSGVLAEIVGGATYKIIAHELAHLLGLEHSETEDEAGNLFLMTATGVTYSNVLFEFETAHINQINNTEYSCFE